MPTKTTTVTELHAFSFEPSTTTSGTASRKSQSLDRTVVASDSEPEAPAATSAKAPSTLLPRARALIVITQLCGLLFFSSFCNGIIVIALPAMHLELGLQESLLVWPTSSYYLTAGSCLLLAGSVADVVGVKKVNLVGSFLSSIFALACGLAQTEGQIIAFRALQGITNAIIAPSAISLISNSVAEGRPRNMGFACLGFSQPLGFSLGLVLTGVMTDTVGWRPAFYLVAACSIVLSTIGIWSLPRDVRLDSKDSVWKRLASEIDWVGVGLASMGLAMFSYVLASLSANINVIRQAVTIALLVVAGFSVPGFVGWMHYQTKKDRTALIPNALWRSGVFTTACVMVMLTNALINCMELYSSLFFQTIQGQSALMASLQVLPSLVAGIITSILTGIFVNRMPVFWTVLITTLVSTASPLLMALVRTDQLYWGNAFVAQIFSPISCDLLFTVGLLIISDVFPKHMQALGGAVFNTCAQLGVAIGLSVTQVVASSVTNNSEFKDKSTPDALMKGYRVAFWIMFGWMAFVCVVCAVGLRRVGAIGVKRD
ncbi:major facilitator superfamily domain-containing protein [Apiosordaria backusii]|uniref:Major facilitator superfamily domain-containing protein n=1 Tax=Apiosordaria backusii TaxID=314023 RepID=A0AA39ZY94_9PEZI|nr:major facilitator superfamily domain-containing protein [Apiosordaria backusii]